MPWFPDFVSAAELVRKRQRAAGQADPVGQYLAALNSGDTHLLEDVWPAAVVVYDPRAGEVRGHRELRHFVKRSRALLSERHARTETVAATVVGRRAVVELLAHLTSDGTEVAWPVAVVAESPDQRSVVFRTYLSERAIDGRAHHRSPILASGTVELSDVVSTYQATLAAGDLDGVVKTFAEDGYLREAFGSDNTHRGAIELRSFFSRWLASGAGISLEACAVTDDGLRCAVEYNVVRAGSQAFPPQAGIAVFERATDGLLAAVRVYDDAEVPVD